MPIDDAYLDVDEFKERSRSTSAVNDYPIEVLLTAASRLIDNECGRFFGQVGTEMTPAVRYYSLPDRAGWAYPRPSGWLGPIGGVAGVGIGDVVSVAALDTDDGSGDFATAWTTDDYLLTPRNAATEGWPYTAIEAAPRGTLAFPTGPNSIRVSGVFGWPAVPAPIVEACFLITNRLKSLWDAPFGKSGGGEMGGLDMTGSITPILRAMLAPYRVLTT